MEDPACAPGPGWTAIVLTSTNRNRGSAFLAEFRRRQSAGFIPAETHVLTVDDPQTKVGSGGATLNALLVVTEYLSAQAGHTVVTAETLEDARVLVLHLGGSFPCDPCGKAFTTFGALTSTDESRLLTCNVDHLLMTMGRLSHKAPPGVWVCSTEMLLSLPSDVNLDWTHKTTGMAVISCMGGVAYAQKHGVYKQDAASGQVSQLLYQKPVEVLRDAVIAHDQVALVSGIVRMCPRTAEKLLSLLSVPPLDACTYIGLDNGAQPLALSLFLDIVAAMATDMDEDTFVAPSADDDLLRRARTILFRRVHNVDLHLLIVRDATHVYMPLTCRQHAKNLFETSPLREEGSDVEPTRSTPTAKRTWGALTHVEVSEGAKTDGTVMINSWIGAKNSIGAGSVVTHCHLAGAWDVGTDCFMSGIDAAVHGPMRVANGIALFQRRIMGQDGVSKTVWTIFGVDDDLGRQPESFEASTFCNESWSNLFERTSICESDLWFPGAPRCLATARLFPVWLVNSNDGATGPRPADVMWLQPGGTPAPAQVSQWRESWRVSLQTIMGMSDTTAEFRWRRELFFNIGDHHTYSSLMNPSRVAAGAEEHEKPSQCLTPFFLDCAYANRLEVLEVLDRVAIDTASPGVAARTLACIADMLGILAGARAGLRSGPGRNPAFMPAFKLLEEGAIKAGVKSLAQERGNWLGSPEATIRAARHYEAASQILTRHAVMTARQFISTSTKVENRLAPGQFVKVEACARIDIAGGWTDTPPITYEHGGVVCNAAVTLDGKRPIGAKASRIVAPKIVLVLEGETTQRLEVSTLKELGNYTQPQSPGALLKAAFCCAEIVSLDASGTLAEQLMEQHGGGFELHTWSNLPTGSGMGTSSILAGTVMAALWRAAGSEYTMDSLVHAVLHLEQMLTTGGGWQDQVGGLVGGVKMSSSAAALPLKVDVEEIPLEKEFLQKLTDHLVVIYTGKTRLARNLLQNVVRNWYARSPAIVANADNLTANAARCAEAFGNRDLTEIGRCLTNYWEQKKLMAPGCEPSFVKRMIEIMAPHAHGQSMAGAGGGGFMYVIAKKPHAAAELEALVRAEIHMEDMTFHQAAIEADGIVVTVGGDKV